MDSAKIGPLDQHVGPWTKRKHAALVDTAKAFAREHSGERNRYVEYFAGQGWNNMRPDGEFTHGSTVKVGSLGMYDELIFAEKDLKTFKELERTVRETLANQNVILIKGDSNRELGKRLARLDKRPTFVFVDPYGMQFSWKTMLWLIEQENIDILFLYPSLAVNRMMTRDDDPISGPTIDKFSPCENWLYEGYCYG